jgi:hypothetical protein
LVTDRGDGYGGHGRARIDGGGSREKRTTGSQRHGGETGRQGALGAILYSVIRDSHVEAGTRALSASPFKVLIKMIRLWRV